MTSHFNREGATAVLGQMKALTGPEVSYDLIEHEDQSDEPETTMLWFCSAYRGAGQGVQFLVYASPTGIDPQDAVRTVPAQVDQENSLLLLVSGTDEDEVKSLFKERYNHLRRR